MKSVTINERSERTEHRFTSTWKSLKRDKYLYFMALVGVAWFLIFHYLPVYGVQVAFKRYNPFDGIWRSQWVGLHWFRVFVTGPYFFRIFRNTLLLGLYGLIFGFWPPILFALMLNEVRHSTYKRAIQTISYLPHFIATVVIVGMLVNFFAIDGVVNTALLLLGRSEPIQFFNRPDWFRPLYIGSGVWQSLGFSSIIYLAVLSGINPEIYEDAVICGANRLQRIVYITLPAMLPTISILLILSVGRIISVGFDKVYMMYNPLIYETADVIATYVYRMGLEQGQISFGAAVGLFNNIVSLILVVTVNWVNRRVSGFSLW